MTLIGTNIAVISLGLACQGAFQLREHAALVSSLLGEDLTYQSCFFNWMLSHMSGVIGVIRDQPESLSPSDFVTTPKGLKLRDYPVWLFDEPHDMPLDVAASKYTHHLQALWSARSRRRRVFLLQNCQNNLVGLTPFLIDRSSMRQLRGAIDHAFPGGQNTIIVVSDSRWPRLVGTYRMPLDNTAWEGSKDNWRDFLQARLGMGRLLPWRLLETLSW